MVSVAMKYADNILKGFATSVSIVLSTLLSTTVMGNSRPSSTFLVGTSIVLCASVIYGLSPAGNRRLATDGKEQEASCPTTCNRAGTDLPYYSAVQAPLSDHPTTSSKVLTHALRIV